VDEIEITPLTGPLDARVVLPGSKSITNRAMVLAALGCWVAFVRRPDDPVSVAACAGALGHSRTRFMLVLAAARIPRYLALAYLGAVLGENSLHWVTGHIWYFVAAAIALSLLLFMLIRFTGREQSQRP